MIAFDIMHKVNPLPLGCNLAEAHDILQQGKTDFLPVVDEDKYVGIVSKDSLLKAILKGLTHDANIKGCLDQNIPSVQFDTPILANYSAVVKNGAISGAVCVFQD